MIAMLGLVALQAFGQTPPTPISVGPLGLGPLTFDTMPNLADGWSTRSVGGSAGTITASGGLDSAVALLDKSTIITNLGSSTTIPPSLNLIARWNGNTTSGHFIQTRPTTDDYLVLMATLKNDTGIDRNIVIIDYDLAGVVSSDATPSESSGLWAHRVYYSLTGAAGTWVHISDLDTADRVTSGHKTATVSLASPWESGANLYLLWADDNGPDSDTANGPKEVAWEIDNFAISLGVNPVAITTQPHSVTVEQCRDTNLTVVATGTSPQYQWFKDGSPITGANGTTLAFNNAQSTANGTYFVRVSNSKPSTVDSDHVTVTVNPDTTPPAVLSAVAKVNLKDVVVTFSEPVNTNGLDTSAYVLVPAAGGDTMSPSAITASTDARTLTLHFDDPRTQNANYDFYIDANLGDACADNKVAGDFGLYGVIVPLKYEVSLIALDDTQWKYKADYSDPGTDWRLDPGYDDTAWLDGVAVFDGKQETTGFTPTPRTTLSGRTIHTQLPLRIPPGTTTTNIPCYYFRTHFTPSVPVASMVALDVYTWVDDFDVAWVNGNNTPLRANPGNPLVNLDTFGYSGGTAVGDATNLGPFSVSSSMLVDGDNLICVKLFQQAVGSSDISFGYELVATVNSFSVGPRLSISQSGGTVTITWTDQSATLYQADSVDATGASWTAVSGAGGGQYQFSAGSTAGAKFYTLRQ